MAKKLTCICIALSMLMILGLTGIAYTLPADADAVTVTKTDGVYTVFISNSVYKNTDVTVTAVANGNEIPESMADASVAYFNEKAADVNGEVTFTFKPKEDFNNENGLYVAVSTKRGVDTVIAKAEYTVDITSLNGVVSCDKETVKEGDTLNFTVNPNFGYQVSKVTVDGKDATANGLGGYVVSPVTDDVLIVAEYDVAPAEIGGATVFESTINPSEFAAQYGEDMTEDALNAKYAAVIFSKVSSLSYEYGIVYSKTNENPTIDAKDSTVKKALKAGSKGAFGMYLHSEKEVSDIYYVRTYVKSGSEYIYSDVTTFTLNEVTALE